MFVKDLKGNVEKVFDGGGKVTRQIEVGQKKDYKLKLRSDKYTQVESNLE